MSNLVFVSGCFDLLHSGHVTFLETAAQFGPLAVSLGSDATISALKGRAPVCHEQERLYLVRALRCVNQAFIASGAGLLDFRPELERLRPAKFVVNCDGDHPSKRDLCIQLGIEYIVLKREPLQGLTPRSTSALRDQQSIPARIDLAGGWLDQPLLSRVHAGAVIVASIDPPHQMIERAGLASSTRATAQKLWGNRIPPGDPLEFARLLFSYENPPDKLPVTGSQDALGIVLPGIHRLHYAGRYWPESIETLNSFETYAWLEAHAQLLLLPPRPTEFDVFRDCNLVSQEIAALARAADDTWRALQNRDIETLIHAINSTAICQANLFPHSLTWDYHRQINELRMAGYGVKFVGAGGGGYLLVVASQSLVSGIPIRIRRPAET